MISAFSSFIDHLELSQECRFFSSQLLEVLECTANKRFSKTNLPVLASAIQQDEMLLCCLCSLFRWSAVVYLQVAPCPGIISHRPPLRQ